MDYQELDLHHRRLTENPTDPTSFAVLRDFFQQQGQYAQLAELYEFRAGNLGDPRERAEHLFHAATIWVDHENNRPRGQRDLEEAFRLQPSHEAIGDRLEQLHRDVQNYGALTQLMTQRILAVEQLGEIPDTARLRSRLYQNLGEIKEKVDNDVKEAIRCYKRAYAIDPSNVLALYFAREIYRRAGDMRSAAKLYELEIRAEQAVDRQATLLIELATIRADSLDDLDGAVEALDRAVALQPNNADTLYDLSAMLTRRAQSPTAHPDDTRRAADCLYQLAQVGDPAQAVEYLEYALDLQPAHDAALQLYVQRTTEAGDIQRQAEHLRKWHAAQEPGSVSNVLLRALGQLEWDRFHNAEAARPLFRLLAERGDPLGPAKLAEVGGGAVVPLAAKAPPRSVPRAESLPDFVTTPAGPSEAGGDIDSLFGEPAAPAPLPVPGPAAAPKRRPAAPEQAPTRLMPPEVVEAMAGAADAAAAAGVAREEEEEERAPAPAAAGGDVEHLRDQAQRLRMLGKDAEVEGIMERIVAQLPGDPEAVAYLERRYRARGNFAGLHKMLMEAGLSRGLAPNVRVMRLKEAAALAEGRLNDAEGAVTAWKRVIAIDPNHGDARRSLERLLRKLEKWADLVELLEQRVQMAEDEAEKLQLLTRIAGLQETQLKDQSATLDTLWRIHAQEEREVKHLKKIETLADQTQRWEDLARVLQVQVEMAATSAEKLRAREKLLVTQQEKLNAHPEALETVDAILAEHRDHLPTLKRQVDLFVTTAQPDRAADALDALVGKLPEKERPAALGRLAELARTELKDLPRAADALNRALQLDPTNESVREELHKMYEELGRFPDIAASYEVWAKAVKDPAKRKALLRRAAQVYDQQVGDIEAACERYGMILKEGDDVEALEAFARLHEMQQDWAALVDNVVRRANLAAPPEDKARLLTEAAQILDGRLGEPAKAAVHLKRILAELSPDHRETLGRLVDVLVRADDYRGAAGALERLREATQDPEEALKHSETLGQWYREPLQDYPKAIATYERILQDWSGHGGALLALTELYDKVADYEKLLRVLRQRSKAADLPPDQANLLLEGAKVAEDKLKDAERAWGWYQEALARDPDSGDLFDAVTAAGRRLAKWESLAGLFEAAATRARTEEERVQRLREAAKVWEEDAKSTVHALEDMVEALRLIPTDDTLLGDADRLAKIGAHWELLGKAYDHLLRRADLVDDRVALLRRFASTVLDDGRRPEFALGPLLRAMEEHPDDNSLFESYEKAARASGHYEDLLRAYDKRCRLATEPQARWPHMLRAAEVYAISMGNLNKGLQVVGLAIGQDVFSDDLAELALRAVRNIEEQVPPDKKGTGWRWLVQHYERLANQYELTDPTRIVFHRRIATVQLDGAGDPAAAFEAMRMAHLLAPTDELLVQDLEKLAREHSFLEPLAAHFADALQRSTRVDVAKDLHRRRAALLEDDLGRADEAAEHYWQLLQLDPDDTEARQKIARYYESAGRWNDLVVILEEDLSKVLYEDEKIALLNRIAAIWEDKIGNRYEAIDSYRKILRLRPDDDDIKAKIKRLSAPRLAATPEDTMEGEEAPAPPPESAAPASEPESSGEAAAPAPPPGEEVSDTAPEGLAPREPAVPEPSSATLTEGLAAAGEAPAAEAPAAEAPPEGAVPGEPGGPSLPTWDERDDSSRVAFSQLEFVQQGGAAPAEPRDTTPEEPGAPAGEPFVVGPPAEEPSPPTPPPGRAGQDTTGEIDVASIEEVPEPAPPRAPSTPPPLPTGARGGPPKGAPPRKRRW